MRTLSDFLRIFSHFVKAYVPFFRKPREDMKPIGSRFFSERKNRRDSAVPKGKLSIRKSFTGPPEGFF